MKILVIADEESKALYDFYQPEKLEGVELIISCGDLHANYLEFLVTLAGCPVLYVHGNHDSAYEKHPPDGCIDIDDKIITYRGLRIMGLGGSMRYKPGPYMYTEKEMKKRIRKMRRQLRFTGGIDILVTHAPAKGYGDMDDLPHRGFACFNTLLRRYVPMVMLYGHVHQQYGAGGWQRVRRHKCGTTLINGYESYLLDYPDEAIIREGHSGHKLYDLYLRGKNAWRRRFSHSYLPQ